jgi:DNA repair exonuclease SbcCD ATPase subunit
MPKLFKPDNTAAKHDTPFTKPNKAEDKPSSEGSVDMEPISRLEGQRALENIKKLEARLKEEEERNKASSQVKKLNEKISDRHVAQKSVEKDFSNNKKALEEKNVDMTTKISQTETVVTKQGAGYLSEGTAIELGVIDGDEEIKVLKKVRRLEARLEAERNKVKALGEELEGLQAAKESVENDFANTKKELEEKNNDLLEEISALESKLKETESRAIAAVQELNPVKKELLKTQIAETKAQQELYKLKIENLKNDEE